MHKANSPDAGLRNILGDHPYFARATAAQLDELLAHARRHLFVAGKLLFLAGEPSAGLHILEEGRVKAVKTLPDGREHILHFLGPGDTFNDVPAFDGEPNPASAIAVTDGAVWVIPTAAIQDALARHHELALGVIHGLNARMRHLVLQIEDLALRSVTARLARFLLEQRHNPSLAGPAITRALIATHLGTTPETVSRALRTLEETGALEFDRHRIIIHNSNLLREIALL